eukprot:Gb_37150 [translate_table: standard]
MRCRGGISHPACKGSCNRCRCWLKGPMSTQLGEASTLRKGCHKRIGCRWWGPGSIRLSTIVIDKKCFYVWVRPWIFTELMLPVQTLINECPQSGSFQGGELQLVSEQRICFNKLFKLH